MAEQSIGLRLNMDASQMTGQLKGVAEDVKSLNAALKETTESGDWKAAADITQVMANLSSAQKTINDMMRQQGMAGGSAGISGKREEEKSRVDFGKMLMNVGNTFMSAVEQFTRASTQFARGDYIGAGISRERAVGQTIKSAGQDVMDITKIISETFKNTGKDMKGLGIAGDIVGVLLNLIGGGIGIHSSFKEKEKAEADRYTNMLPYMVGVNRLYNPASEKFIREKYGIDKYAQDHNMSIEDAYKATNINVSEEIFEENKKRQLGALNTASKLAGSAGMTNQEFLSAMQGDAQYGKTGGIDAVVARTARFGRLAYATGADLGTMQSLAGTARRYGDTGDAVGIAWTGLNKTGMERGQLNEFMSSLEKVMEDGISKGYLKTSEEIAANLTMFARLSGDSPFWQGEQGAKRMIAMGNAISGATELGDAGDMILFQAADSLFKDGMTNEQRAKLTGQNAGDWNGSYIDTQLLLERNVSPELMGSYFDMVGNMYGNNVTGQIEEFRRGLDLNYTGATQLYTMKQNRQKEIDELVAGGMDVDKATAQVDKSYENEMKEIIENPEFKTNEVKMLDAVNNIDANVIKIAAWDGGSFDKMMREYEKILRELIKRIEDKADGSYDDIDSAMDDAEAAGIKLPPITLDPNKDARDALADKAAQEGDYKTAMRLYFADFVNNSNFSTAYMSDFLLKYGDSDVGKKIYNDLLAQIQDPKNAKDWKTKGKGINKSKLEGYMASDLYDRYYEEMKREEQKRETGGGVAMNTDASGNIHIPYITVDNLNVIKDVNMNGVANG